MTLYWNCNLSFCPPICSSHVHYVQMAKRTSNMFYWHQPHSTNSRASICLSVASIDSSSSSDNGFAAELHVGREILTESNAGSASWQPRNEAEHRLVRLWSKCLSSTHKEWETYVAVHPIIGFSQRSRVSNWICHLWVPNVPDCIAFFDGE